MGYIKSIFNFDATCLLTKVISFKCRSWKVLMYNKHKQLQSISQTQSFAFKWILHFKNHAASGNPHLTMMMWKTKRMNEKNEQEEWTRRMNEKNEREEWTRRMNNIECNYTKILSDYRWCWRVPIDQRRVEPICFIVIAESNVATSG